MYYTYIITTVYSLMLANLYADFLQATELLFTQELGGVSCVDSVIFNDKQLQ